MRDFIGRYSLPILILLLTFIAAVLAVSTARLLALTPTFAALAGVGFGMLFGVGLLVLAQYGSTIEPVTQDEYDELNDPDQNQGGPDGY